MEDNIVATLAVEEIVYLALCTNVEKTFVLIRQAWASSSRRKFVGFLHGAHVAISAYAAT